MPPDLPSRHTRLRMREYAFVRYYHYATILYSSPPPKFKILYETLEWIEAKSMLLTSK